MTHFRFYCTVYIFVRICMSDFHELATSRDEYKRIVGETELPVMIIVCAVSVVGACGSNLSCFFRGYTSLSQRHLGH